MSSTAAWRSASLCATRSASGSGYPASISTWSRQPSTLARSLCSCSAICVIVVPAADSFSVCESLPTERRDLTRQPLERVEPSLGARHRLVDPAGQLGEPILERPLLVRERREPLPEVRLDVAEPFRERRDELVALALQAGRDLSHLLLQPQAAGLAELRHPVGQQRLTFAGEPLHGTLQLALQPPRRLF